MRGIIMQDVVHESAVDAARGDTVTVQRIFFPELNDLAITRVNNRIHVVEECTFNPGAKQLGEVEVPGEIIDAAREFFRAKCRLEGFIGKLETLIEKGKY